MNGTICPRCGGWTVHSGTPTPPPRMCNCASSGTPFTAPVQVVAIPAPRDALDILEARIADLEEDLLQLRARVDQQAHCRSDCQATHNALAAIVVGLESRVEEMARLIARLNLRHNV